MLENFRKKIVFINVLFIGTILVTVCVISFLYNKKTLYESHNEQFINSCILLEETLISSNTINYRDIQDFILSKNIYIYLFDNGNLIDIRYGHNIADNALLLDLQLALKEESNDIILNQEQSSLTLNFQFISDKQDYFARYSLFNTTSENQLELIMAQSMESYQNKVLESLSLFTSLTIFSFVIIFILNNYFSKKAINPAIKAQKSQIEFIAAASHELKTPIAVIQSSAEMLCIDLEHQENYITNITSETKRMKRLVEDLLLLSSLDSNRAQFKKSLVDSEELLLSTYEKFLPITLKSKHKLQLLLQENELPKICVDSDRMIQVLAILLDNAISYTPSNTKIVISATEISGYLVISIIDHGEGILDKENIFVRFYRSDKSRTSKNHFGLGLSIANEIIKNFNGSISLIDTENGGATFIIKIPTCIK